MAYLRSLTSAGWFVPVGLAVIGLVALLILWKLPRWQVGRLRGLNSKEQRVRRPGSVFILIVGQPYLLGLGPNRISF